MKILCVCACVCECDGSWGGMCSQKVLLEDMAFGWHLTTRQGWLGRGLEGTQPGRKSKSKGEAPPEKQ